jgi:acyl-CoA thioesterase YciA
MTKNIGINGNLFGGEILSWIDQAAASFATEKCYTPHVVTGTMEKVVFKSPVKVGEIIKLYGEILNIGNKSITLRIEARNFSPYTHEENMVCSTDMTFVRIDPTTGKSIPISKHVKLRFENSREKIEVNDRVKMDVTIASKLGFDDEVEGTVVNILSSRSDLPIVVQLDECDHLEYFRRDELINLTKKKNRKARKSTPIQQLTGTVHH